MTIGPIALVIPVLSLGGAERVTVVLANELALQGHEVDLVVGASDGPLRSRVSPDVNVVDLGIRKWRSALGPLSAYLRTRRPQSALSSSTWPNLLLPWARALARSDTRIVLAEHNTIALEARYIGTPMHRLVLAASYRNSYRRADAIVAVSQGVAEELMPSFGGRVPVTVINNPLPLDEIRSLASEPVNHRWFEEPDGLPIVLSVGRLVPGKAVDATIRAVHALSNTDPVRLLVVGEGPEKGALEDLTHQLEAERYVEFAGAVENPYSFMSRADCLVLSSRTEALPLVVAEALAVGCPVVSTDCAHGPRELLDAGRLGRLVAVDDVPGLADAIRKTLSDPPDRKTLQDAAERWDAAVIAREYAEILVGNSEP